jgi:CSLREA domain-containing protein
MANQNAAIHPSDLESTSAAARQDIAMGMRALLMTVIAPAFALALLVGTPYDARGWVTITVNSLADPGEAGVCTLRDAITAANTKTATSGCPAGNGHDMIAFRVKGTILLGSTLPQVTDTQLTIKGPASPGITIDGGDQVRVMQVASGATVKLSNLSIARGRVAFDSGGGILNGGTLTITNSTFSGNKALGGGGIENYGTLTVTNSIFSDNSIFRYVGGGIDNTGKLVVTNSTFSGNMALNGGYGGGIGNLCIAPACDVAAPGVAAGTLTVINSTFSGNFALLGGSIENEGTLTVTSSTFAGNAGIGTAINGPTIHGPAKVRNTILANGRSNCSGQITDAGYNISDDASCAFSATGSLNNTNPLLDPAGLANNGGPTPTIALLPGSPAIDAIPLAHCTDQASPPNPIITDQRGFPRPDSGESACDIGAFEVQDFPFIPFSTFGGGLRIDPDAGIFVLGGRFVLGSGATIDPASQPVALAVGNDAVRLPAGSFVPDSVGYVYQKTINGIARYIHIKFTSTPGLYQLVALRKGGTLTTTTSPVPVTLTIGDNGGGTQMNTTFF